MWYLSNGMNYYELNAKGYYILDLEDFLQKKHTQNYLIQFT